METMIFKTPCQTEREARDLAIYNEYNALIAVEGQSKNSRNGTPDEEIQHTQRRNYLLDSPPCGEEIGSAERGYKWH